MAGYLCVGALVIGELGHVAEWLGGKELGPWGYAILSIEPSAGEWTAPHL